MIQVLAKQMDLVLKKMMTVIKIIQYIVYGIICNNSIFV